jgi:hypothetical protein
MIEPFHVAILIFVIAPAVILGAAAFTAAVTSERKQDDEQ